MRVPGWIIGIGVVGWLLGTVACSAGAFISARQLQLDSVESGIPLPDLQSFANRATATFPPELIAQAPTATPVQAEDSAAQAAATISTPQVVPQQPAAEPTVLDDNALVRSATRRLGPRSINVLLMGIDQRSAVESADTEFFRTDTMIVVRIDPVRRTVGMISVPRDLYVPIPGFEEARINVANVLGDSGGYPGGGPALAMRTIEDTLGVEIDHYVLVNFDVFLRVVDTVAPNGVEICIPQEIYDPFYPDEGYGFIEVRFEAGCQRLNSTELLQYARTRKTEGSDFDRSRRQQQVILAVQQQVVSAGGITNLVTRAPALWQELGNNLRTDMPFETALDLALVSTTIDSDNVNMAQINNLHVQFAKDDDGNDILIPVPASISELVQSTFNTSGGMTEEDIRERAVAEGATVIVLNNTTTTGLAGTTRERLNAAGIPVVNVGNTQAPDNTNTVIKDYTGNPWTSRLIADALGIPREQIIAGTDGLTSEDIAVLVGPDLE
ncbi:MAG: LCP family protein [Chloroflexota bacterium]